MARHLDRLKARGIDNLRKAGYYADGGGLYLQVSPSLSKSWIYRYTLNGKAREMGFGALHTVSLAEARAKARDARGLLLSRLDPIEARDAEKASEALKTAKAITFAECAEAYIKAHKSAWRNAKHIWQWENTIETHCNPVFGDLAIQRVDTGFVVQALEPIWNRMPETASRLRGRIESIINWATTRGYRQGENPARWRGHLQNVLSAVSRRKRIKHYPAMPFDEVGPFMAKLRAREGVSCRALEFTILVAARTGEVRGAKWPEFDLRAGIWKVPAERMKAGREHRVPLSQQALTLTKNMKEKRLNDYVFPGRGVNEPLSNMAMLEILRRMGHSDITVHGFRSSFRDWAAERTNYPREVCEMALAHTVSDQVEAAYRRGDLFEKRRRLMNEWAKHCDAVRASGKVVAIRRKRA